MMQTTLLIDFLIAIGLGALIGLEREVASVQKNLKSQAGIRTFILISLLGGISAYLAQKLENIWIFIISFILLSLLILVSYQSVSKKGNYGLTTEIAALLIFLIGALTLFKFTEIAAALTILILLLLYGREQLHKLARKIKKQEMYSTLKFAIIAFLILPFIPVTNYLGFLNLHDLWLLVVLISAVSFIGYILTKIWGEKGLQITALTGGIVSSTAVTISLVQRSKGKIRTHDVLLFGILGANVAMILRVLIGIAILNQELFNKIIIPLSVLAIVNTTITFITWKKSKKHQTEFNFKSPFNLKPSIEFAILFTIILGVLHFAQQYQTTIGIYLAGGLAGLIKTDSITLPLAQLTKKGLDINLATNIVLLATFINSAAKVGVAYIFGDKKFATKLLIYISIILIISGAIISLI